MERKISYEDLRKAVDEAYEQYKTVKEGTVSPYTPETDTCAFGISVMLTDGRKINKADTGVLFPIGQIAKVPLSAVLLSQNTPDALVDKSGFGEHCRCQTRPDVPFSAHGIRAVSAVVPAGDPEGKYGVIMDTFLDMTTGEPVLDDKLYIRLKDEAAKADVTGKLAEAHYELYDDAALAIDLYLKLNSLQMTTEQLAVLGATVAADGRNPLTGEYAFDGAITSRIVTLMATGRRQRGWMMRTGVPARRGFAGGILAVLPGFGAIATYAPALCACGYSLKGARAIEYITNKLGLNVYASARVAVDK